MALAMVPFFYRRFCSSASAWDSGVVNEICRILSDHRCPEHDLESALAPFSSSLSPSIAEQVLKRCRRLPSPSHRFFVWSTSLPSFVPTPASALLLLDLLASARLFPLAWSLLSDSRSLFSTPDSFRILFRAYARASLPSHAVRAFLRMPHFGIHPSLSDLHHLLSALSRHRLALHALAFFRLSYPRFPVSQKTFTLLISGLALLRCPHDALRLFHEMQIHHGLPPDLPSFNSLFSALCRSGLLDSALERLRDMTALHGLLPDSATFAVFIRAYCESKDLDSALRVFRHARTRGLALNLFTCNALLRLQCQQGLSSDAHHLLDEMLQSGPRPDAWSYNAVLALHCRLREVNKALGLLARMDRDSCPPDRHTYNMLLKMLICVGRFDRADEVWEGMEKRGFFPSVSSYAVMVHGLCRKKGRIDEACRYFEMMLDDGLPPFESTCVVLCGELRRFGLVERIEALAGKMRRSSSRAVQELSNAIR